MLDGLVPGRYPDGIPASEAEAFVQELVSRTIVTAVTRLPEGERQAKQEVLAALIRDAVGARIKPGDA
jgi:hypothetical protein